MAGKKDPTQATGRCLKCRHYYLTWDPRFPHGCRAFGFKAAGPPSQLVFKSSGVSCQLFEAKGSRR
ncbi:uracil-DNA glycosylase [Thermosulfuriphilus sp.]